MEGAARDLIEDLALLVDLAGDLQVITHPDRIAAVGVETMPTADRELAREEAEERMARMAEGVMATTTFEVALAGACPGRALCFECDRVEMNAPYVEQTGERFTYEIRRVLYRRSWDGSAETELSGEDREVAEAFGRRVVVELVE